jgi:hypothetical protein
MIRNLLRRVILWALQRDEPPYDPATLDKIAAEGKS